MFLDRDDALFEGLSCNIDPAHARFAPCGLEALRWLRASGYLVVLVGSQRGVAQNRPSASDLDALWHTLRRRALDAGIWIAGFHACTHAPDAGCACHKPADGLLRRAAQDHGVDLARSWMVGSVLDDIEAGRSAGCRTVLVDVGSATPPELTPARTPHYRATSLMEAALLITAHSDDHFEPAPHRIAA